MNHESTKNTKHTKPPPDRMKTLVIATQNSGKLEEIRQILGSHIPLKSLADYPGLPNIVEDGDTFEANAIVKARTVARYTGCPALADDSGLEVDALGGDPGVRSARFAGENATDEENNLKLLRLLGKTPKEKRTARFRCVIAVTTPDDAIRTAEGQCEGRILKAPRGDGGFGYDPLFRVPALTLTFAELPPGRKNRISHRGQALRTARPLILDVLSLSSH